MGSTLRNLQADWYHAFHRGADGQDIFSLAGDRHLFEALIGDAIDHVGVEVHAYALMSNHHHLLIRAEDGRLSDFMQRLGARYAAAYNVRTSRTGPLFEGRFGSVPILDDEHLAIEARYIERNPLAFVEAENLPAFAHSSLGVHSGRRKGPSWLSTSFLRTLFKPAEYLSFVRQAHESDFDQRPGLPALRELSLDKLLTAARQVTDADPVKSGVVRNVILAMAADLRVAPSVEVARLFEMTPAGRRQAARRGRVAVDTDPAAASVRRRVMQSLTADSG